MILPGYQPQGQQQEMRVIVLHGTYIYNEAFNLRPVEPFLINQEQRVKVFQLSVL